VTLGFDHDLLQPRNAAVVRETHLLMNSVVNLTLVSDDPGSAKEACAACVREMRRRVDVYNRFDPTSQLSRLNSDGRLKKPDPLLVDLINRSARISEASAGAFDVSIKPVLDEYLSFQALNGGLPPAQELLTALGKVDYRRIVYDQDDIGFALPGMSLTLDGIAKGAVVDAGVDTLRLRGFDNVMVEAAGDLLAAGERALQVPWRIGIRPPRDGMEQQLPILHIKNRAVATSGDYLQAFTSDYSINHILDPRRGFSSTELSSATVIAASASLADSLATTIMVLGAREGLELLGSFPGCEAYLIDKNLRSTCSPGMRAYFADIL
jgi:FAD:protein FMN transferase